MPTEIEELVDRDLDLHRDTTEMPVAYDPDEDLFEDHLEDEGDLDFEPEYDE